ncbi:MAG: tetratricopeptide repeat protein, partial [Saprospiraceae bacterium]
MGKKKSKMGDKPIHNLTTKSVKQKPIISANKHELLWSGLVAIITFFCFYNTLDNGFVNWDDDKNFLEHPAIQHMTKADFWASTKYIFTHHVIGNYNPLANWTFAIEKLWFGFENPKAWHLNNVVLHVISSVLVFKIGSRLGLSLFGAVILALLFGIHPMRVESVAWVTERKDVLFGVFYLGAILQYILLLNDRKNIRWFWIGLFFILSLLSKIQAVSLPLSLIAIDYLLNDKFKSTFIWKKAPLFLLSIFFGILGIYFLKEYGSIDAASEGANYPFYQRLFIGSYSFLVYLIKVVFPYEMSPLYPYPNGFPWYFYMSMIIAPIVVFSLWWSYQKKYKVYFFGMTFFIVNIVFLLQILSAGQGFIADRFTYIAYFGLFFIPAHYIGQWVLNNQDKRWYAHTPAIFVLIVYGATTIQQNKIWKDSGTLWTHVLKYYENTTTPYGNRANFYRDNGKYMEALADYNKSIALKDDQPQAYNSRARLFFTVAKSRDTLLMALRDYNKAIEYMPNDGEFYTNRGATYARLNEIDKAIADLTKGI